MTLSQRTGGLRIRTPLMPTAVKMVDLFRERGLVGMWHVETLGSRSVRVRLTLTKREDAELVWSEAVVVSHREYRMQRGFERLMRRASRGKE